MVHELLLDSSRNRGQSGARRGNGGQCLDFSNWLATVGIWQATSTFRPNGYTRLYDSNAATFNPQQFSLGTGGTATSSWTPTSTGTHYVQAWTYNGSQWATVQVNTGINLGSACVVTK
ncbi:hypothetical protein [Nocardia tengchongensis]|uniref:hypothetical protein n=1 Tax=Nocardia tengchongensis TaxID=2055889 RepID=UPI00367F6002